MAKKAKKQSSKRATAAKNNSKPKRGAKSKRPAAKRDLVKAKNASMFGKRSTKGRFTEMDEVGRSSAVDRRRKAKRKTKSGFGDSGDRKR
jgi:hypothetical protein